jgi:hypothetical protein
MNTEKLNALASEAGFDVERLRAPYPGGFPRDDMLALESFAELIVRECAEICMKEFDTGLLMAPQAPWIAKQIKQYFGVEE